MKISNKLIFNFYLINVIVFRPVPDQMGQNLREISVPCPGDELMVISPFRAFALCCILLMPLPLFLMPDLSNPFPSSFIVRLMAFCCKERLIHTFLPLAYLAMLL